MADSTRAVEAEYAGNGTCSRDGCGGLSIADVRCGDVTVKACLADLGWARKKVEADV